jgi:hypothetical protein
MGTGDTALQRVEFDNLTDGDTVLSCPQRLRRIGTGYEALQDEISYWTGKVSELKQAGVTDATIHWRSDNSAMELLHPSNSEYARKHGRRREYVGKDTFNQRDAKERVERYQQLKLAVARLEDLRQKKNLIVSMIGRLELQLFGQQLNMGIDAGSRWGGLVPTLAAETPQQVIDYFKRSPDLCSMADDVEQLLSPKKVR